jgi:mono/diheme cytochrome c family protein
MSKNSLRQNLKQIRAGRLALSLLPLSFIFFSACRQDMQDQPKYIPLRASKFFANGSSARPLVEGTVPRGFLRENTIFYTGKKPGVPAAGSPGATTAATANPLDGAALYPDAVTEMPLPVDDKLLKRGQDRFQIFCSVCHGLAGQGDGMLFRRGYKQPPPFTRPPLPTVPVGHIFDVITNGWGVMPSYAEQITAQDRWAIVAYVRALQLAQQNAPVPPATGAPTPAASPSPAAGSAPHAGATPAASPSNGGH